MILKFSDIYFLLYWLQTQSCFACLSISRSLFDDDDDYDADDDDNYDDDDYDDDNYDDDDDDDDFDDDDDHHHHQNHHHHHHHHHHHLYDIWTWVEDLVPVKSINHIPNW